MTDSLNTKGAGQEALEAAWQAALHRSSVWATLARLRVSDLDHAGRSMTREEMDLLEDFGNTADDWSQVRLMGKGPFSGIRDNHFSGSVVLRLSAETWQDASGKTWRQSLRRCRLRDCLVGAACVEDVSWLERVRIEDGAVVLRVASLRGLRPDRFGLGRSIPVGTETGLRRVWVWEGIHLESCEAASRLDPETQTRFAERLRSDLESHCAEMAYVGSGALLLGCGRVEDSWIGPGCRAEGAVEVVRATLIGESDRPSALGPGAHAVDCWLEPGAAVESAGRAVRSLLLEQSAVENGGTATQCVLGPNSQVAQGEATHCLLGPFVGFHHQALLIAAIWPEGRGNVAYGANVGSNHTGRKPDQEIRPGEGNFFGLGCSIKFPADFSSAPYSLFSTGVVVEPQRLGFPFSLVVPPRLPHAEGNDLLPAWSWTHNRYALFRNGAKYRDRDRSRHHAFHAALPPEGLLAYSFLAPRIVRLVLAAHDSLTHLLALPSRDAFGPRDEEALGRNRLTRLQAEKALAGYDEYLAFWRWLAVRESRWPTSSQAEVTALCQDVEALWPESGREGCEERAQACLNGFESALLSGLARDDARGAAIQADYPAFHPDPASDPVVQRVLDELAKTKARKA